MRRESYRTWQSQSRNFSQKHIQATLSRLWNKHLFLNIYIPGCIHKLLRGSSTSKINFEQLAHAISDGWGTAKFPVLDQSIQVVVPWKIENVYTDHWHTMPMAPKHCQNVPDYCFAARLLTSDRKLSSFPDAEVHKCQISSDPVVRSIKMQVSRMANFSGSCRWWFRLALLFRSVEGFGLSPRVASSVSIAGRKLYRVEIGGAKSTLLKYQTHQAVSLYVTALTLTRRRKASRSAILFSKGKDRWRHVCVLASRSWANSFEGRGCGRSLQVLLVSFLRPISLFPKRSVTPKRPSSESLLDDYWHWSKLVRSRGRYSTGIWVGGFGRLNETLTPFKTQKM